MYPKNSNHLSHHSFGKGKGGQNPLFPYLLTFLSRSASIKGQIIPIFILLTLCFLSLSSILLAQEEKVIYDDKGIRDPFIALVTPDGRLLSLEPASSESKIILEGITYDKNGYSYAIINNKVVGVGDYILGYAVFKIEKEKVILLKDNKFVEYRID